MGIDFAVRLNLDNNRTLFTSEGKTDVRTLVENTPRLYVHKPRVRLIKKKRGELLQVGWVSDVHLPQVSPSGKPSDKPSSKSYSVVIASGIGDEPLIILTTEDVKTSADANRVVDIYLDRWGIEETNRFVKQGFDLEDVRALTA
jgi:hypothetical protein